MTTLFTLISMLSHLTLAYADSLPEYPFTKAEVNSCLAARNRVGYFLACGKNAEKIVSKECQAMRRERFRTPPLLDKQGFHSTDFSHDAELTVADAAKLIDSDGSSAKYRQAIMDAAKAVDKKLLIVSLAAWTAEIGSWYLLGAGRIVLGAVTNLGGWGMSGISSALFMKNLSEAGKDHLVKAYNQVKDCVGGDDKHALSESEIRQCLEQRLPHKNVVGTFARLVATDGGDHEIKNLRALASEGYSWELPAAQFRVACGIIQGMDETMSAAEKTPLSCDRKTGLLKINGQKFRQSLKRENGEIKEWSLVSAEPFVEVTEGLIMKKKTKKHAVVNLLGSSPEKSGGNTVDLGEGFSRQAALLAPKLLGFKECGGQSLGAGSVDATQDADDMSGSVPAN